MNIRVRLVMLLCAAFFCELRAADVKPDNTPPTKTAVAIELLATKSKFADIALLTLFIPKVWNAILYKRDYASAIFLGSAVALRKDSVIDTCKFVLGSSGDGIGAYTSCLYANPTATLAITAMGLTGAYILGSYINNWWQSVKIKPYLRLGINMGN